jgi:heat-inducible transcriptional repressor
MDDRKAAVLSALVDEHIRTGHPVSSRAILEATRLNVSSATIRNDLSALEAEGYVMQPHTSAGRVPTEKGFRHYVDTAGPHQPVLPNVPS